MHIIEGGINAPGKKFAIIVSRFNHFVVESLLQGAVQTLKQYGQVADDDITVVRVPGAYEIPVTAKRLQNRISLMRLLRSAQLFEVEHRTLILSLVKVIAA